MGQHVIKDVAALDELSEERAWLGIAISNISNSEI